jgi:hypothetical protein
MKRQIDETPRRISMHQRIDKDGKLARTYDHHDHFPKIYKPIRRWLTQHVGKNFNDTYSEFCNKFVPTLRNKYKAIDCFLFEFRYSTYSNGTYVTNIPDTYYTRWGNVYYIDENGNIAKRKRSYKKDKKLYVHTDTVATYNKADYKNKDWKQLLGEIKDQVNKYERETFKKEELYKAHLLEWVEFNRKKNNPDV